MEKAVLKTLIYSDIFDYPLNLSEIHKWLIGKKATPRDLEKAIKKLNQESRIKNYGKYFFLPRTKGSVLKRKKRWEQSKIYIRKVYMIAQIFKIIPWIKLVGISGGLSMENADKKDDIDLILVTSKNRLWISRFLILCLLNLTGQRRKPNQSIKESAGKICCNILIEEDSLEQKRKDLYTAHEVLQMKPLMVRDGIYSKYLEENNWVFKYLPNWVGERVYGKEYKVYRGKTHFTRYTILHTFMDKVENLAKIFQLSIMSPLKGMERIQDGALYFHPNDVREKILQEYKRRIRNI